MIDRWLQCAIPKAKSGIARRARRLAAVVAGPRDDGGELRVRERVRLGVRRALRDVRRARALRDVVAEAAREAPEVERRREVPQRVVLRRPAPPRRVAAGEDRRELLRHGGLLGDAEHLLRHRSRRRAELSASEVAEHVAVAIEADKLIFLDRHEGLADGDGSLIRQSTIGSAEALALADDEQRRLRDAACRACAQGVARSHVLNYSREGSLLEELFTHDGSGTLIAQNPYEQARGAEIEDIASILELIRPLEQSGTLVRRSRERLEEEISHFSILERDGRVLACAALYPYRDERVGEIACVATHPDYQGAGRARHLLSELLNQAKDQSLDHVFVLTTQSTHWFLEQGFETASLEQLPVEKKRLYNWQRSASVLRRAV